MNQVSLIAFYGNKDVSLCRLLISMNNKLKHSLGSAYHPYPISQIHATLIGLESIQRANGIYNYNFYSNYGDERLMQLHEALRLADNTRQLPIKIRIGGYHENTDYGFTSFGQHAWKRSFTIQGDKVVLMGWPTHTAANCHPLAELRRSFEAFGILHKWHRTSQDVDNDCYFVLGLITPDAISAIDVTKTQFTMRNYLAEMTPVTLTLMADTLSFVSYTDVTLPGATTRYLSLPDAVRDPDQLLRLFKSQDLFSN